MPMRRKPAPAIKDKTLPKFTMDHRVRDAAPKELSAEGCGRVRLLSLYIYNAILAPFVPCFIQEWLKDAHGIAQGADLLDLDFDPVAVFEEFRRRACEADAFGRAGCDDVAGLERHAF